MNKLTISILAGIVCALWLMRRRDDKLDRLVSATWTIDDGPCYVLANPHVTHVDYWQPRRNGGIAK